MLERGAAAAPTPAQFRIFFALALIVVFAGLQIWKGAPPPQATPVAWERDGRLHVFYQPDCPHCHRAIDFLKTQSGIDYEAHDITTAAGERLLREVAAALAISEAELAVPLFVLGRRHLMGFESPETLLGFVSETPGARLPPKDATPIRVPVFGEVDPSQYSLFALTAILALADGFNPCAMWVLIYLISLIAGLNEREKIWWLVGTFVLASGILYFLFMTAWLNTFLIVGYIRPLTQLIGLAAIGFGADQLYDLAWNRGVVACEVGNVEQRQRTMARIRDLVTAPVGVTSLVLVTGLAFAVNTIEFICSAAMPAIYTHILTLTDLSTAAYYGYIALYVLFFMLDDLIIFGLAAVAIQTVLDSRYAAISRGVGGVALVSLGLWMLMRPGL